MLGLGEYLAGRYGRKERFEVCESPNDTTYIVDVDGEEPDEWNAKNLARVFESGEVECYYFHLLLNDASRRGFIDNGTYAVGVSW